MFQKVAIIGPGLIGGSMGMALRRDGLARQVIGIGRKVGTPTGIHAMDPLSALKRAEQGMQFIAVGSDLRMLGAKCREYLQVIRPEEGEKDLARY